MKAATNPKLMAMNESILLIEDEKALRTTLSDRLGSEGYMVETAADGLEGLEKATNQPFDLIILDLMLPRRSGLEVCREIRAAGMATPILILTVRNETVDKVVGLKLGADDYVSKPFKAAELIYAATPDPTFELLRDGRADAAARSGSSGASTSIER